MCDAAEKELDGMLSKIAVVFVLITIVIGIAGIIKIRVLREKDIF